MIKSSDVFYSNLPAQRIKLSKLFIQKELFKQVPDDWHIIITDIKGSTKAVLDGFNENVNLIATGSIVTVLNLAYSSGITIPFFFGGDGATFLVPSSILDSALKKLSIFKENTLTNFNLNLRVGTIPVKQIYDAAFQIRISKFHVSEFFSIPVILGDGLSYAEKLIKAEDYLLAPIHQQDEILDLNGMQCRWDKIDPPQNSNEVVTLLVVINKSEEQPKIFSAIVNQLDIIYGEPKKRQPISVDKLRFNTTFNRLSREMRTRIGEVKIFELMKTWVINLYGYIYFRTESGKNYLNRLVEMSDTLVLDGKINTVISGNEQQRLKLIKYLDKLEAQGSIVYGLYVSPNSTMSCYVRDLVNEHIHFVDGSEGGYTQAARILKAKISDK
ncbi:DUF3095 domain-containing protein [Pedobacter mendelii]|uniref:DUF3095 domain-containing protein n=1 Tax=Pedobacter mendelii TaxID=1908240 RepID=A0ABQ2BPX7_9SPHI|nr:DUF3095 domain-containing protein [Pedobacter mendelii]GGI29411.1 hypothetical protein GCM10008119_37490 [Pedobacter mendelii]